MISIRRGMQNRGPKWAAEIESQLLVFHDRLCAFYICPDLLSSVNTVRMQ